MVGVQAVGEDLGRRRAGDRAGQGIHRGIHVVAGQQDRGEVATELRLQGPGSRSAGDELTCALEMTPGVGETTRPTSAWYVLTKADLEGAVLYDVLHGRSGRR